jgi:hypothetical protein
MKIPAEIEFKMNVSDAISKLQRLGDTAHRAINAVDDFNKALENCKRMDLEISSKYGNDMAIYSGEIAGRLLQAFGLNFEFVGEITIIMKPNEVVKINITHYMMEKQAEKLIEVMKEYRLVEKSIPPTFPEPREYGKNKTDKET